MWVWKADEGFGRGRFLSLNELNGSARVRRLTDGRGRRAVVESRGGIGKRVLRFVGRGKRGRKLGG